MFEQMRAPITMQQLINSPIDEIVLARAIVSSTAYDQSLIYAAFNKAACLGTRISSPSMEELMRIMIVKMIDPSVIAQSMKVIVEMNGDYVRLVRVAASVYEVDVSAELLNWIVRIPCADHALGREGTVGRTSDREAAAAIAPSTSATKETRNSADEWTKLLEYAARVLPIRHLTLVITGMTNFGTGISGHGIYATGHMSELVDWDAIAKAFANRVSEDARETLDIMLYLYRVEVLARGLCAQPDHWRDAFLRCAVNNGSRSIDADAREHTQTATIRARINPSACARSRIDRTGPCLDGARGCIAVQPIRAWSSVIPSQSSPFADMRNWVPDTPRSDARGAPFPFISPPATVTAQRSDVSRTESSPRSLPLVEHPIPVPSELHCLRQYDLRSREELASGSKHPDGADDADVEPATKKRA
jgi:hypothetical protein